MKKHFNNLGFSNTHFEPTIYDNNKKELKAARYIMLTLFGLLIGLIIFNLFR